MRLSPELMVCLESYQEQDESTATHNGVEYYLNPIFELTHGRAVSDVAINKLDWILKYDSPKPYRVARADTAIPIIVVRDPSVGHTGLVVLDGLHRLARAKQDGLKTIPVRLVTMKEIEPFKKE